MRHRPLSRATNRPAPSTSVSAVAAGAVIRGSRNAQHDLDGVRDVLRSLTPTRPALLPLLREIERIRADLDKVITTAHDLKSGRS